MTFKDIVETSVGHVYLGFCEQKGYIYSVQTSIDRHTVVAVKNNIATTLIAYRPKHSEGGIVN